jgi:hypothetical protein
MVETFIVGIVVGVIAGVGGMYWLLSTAEDGAVNLQNRGNWRTGRWKDSE